MQFIIVLFLISALFGFETNGILKPKYSAKLSFATSGIVWKIYKKEGDTIKKGEVIIKLDDSLALLNEKRANYLYEESKKDNFLEQSINLMKKILESKERVYKQTKAVSLNELYKLKMQYLDKQLQLKNFEETKAKYMYDFLLAKEKRKYYELYSPVDGIITKIVPEIGEWIEQGKVVVEVVDKSKCFVEVNIEAKVASRLKLNQKAFIFVEINNKEIKKEGIIKFISPVADSSSSLVRVKVYFNNKDLKVIPGILARVVINDR